MSSTSWPSDASSRAGVARRRRGSPGRTARRRSPAWRTGRSAAGRARGRRPRGTSPGGGGGAQERVARRGPAMHVEQRGRVADGPGQRPADGSPVVSRDIGAVADPAARRLEPEQPADAGRDPDRAAAVRSPAPPATSPAGDRRRRSPARAAGHRVEVPRRPRRWRHVRSRCSRASRTPGCWSCRWRRPPAASGHDAVVHGRDVVERRGAVRGADACRAGEVLGRDDGSRTAEPAARRAPQQDPLRRPGLREREVIGDA